MLKPLELLVKVAHKLSYGFTADQKSLQSSNIALIKYSWTQP